LFVNGRPAEIYALYAFAVAAVLAWVLVPATEKLARRINAIDVPNERSLHAIPTPKLGGSRCWPASWWPGFCSCRGRR